MTRSLVVSLVLHLVILAGLAWCVGTMGPGPRPVVAVHLGTPRAASAPVPASLPRPPEPPAPEPVAPPQAGPGPAASPVAPSSPEAAAGLPGDNLSIDALTPGVAVEKPALLSYPAPVYPREARRNAWEGVVEVEITVDAQGRGSDLKVIRTSGHQGLDEAALEALRQARYEPATRNGVAEPGVLDAVVRFRLN